VNLFFRQFRLEVVKLFARKRTWIGFCLFVAFEILVFALFNTRLARESIGRAMAKQGALFAEYGGGLSIGFFIFIITSVLLGSIFLALVAGDIVAKEVEDGTMRMTLCRPVSRVRVLMVKLATCMLHHFVFLFFIGITILLVGILWRGVGGLFLYLPEDKLLAIFPRDEGLRRYFMALPAFALSFSVVTTMAFLFSCCNAKPVVATVLSIVILFIDRVLYVIPYLENFRPFFMATRTVTWMNVLQQDIPWARMAEDYLYLFGLNATFIIIGCGIFCRRDFKS
jgi:ABC-2 type transport system permease protein